jgi:hypothetical protein
MSASAAADGRAAALSQTWAGSLNGRHWGCALGQRDGALRLEPLPVVGVIDAEVEAVRQGAVEVHLADGGRVVTGIL